MAVGGGGGALSGNGGDCTGEARFKSWIESPLNVLRADSGGAGVCGGGGAGAAGEVGRDSSGRGAAGVVGRDDSGGGATGVDGRDDGREDGREDEWGFDMWDEE